MNSEQISRDTLDLMAELERLWNIYIILYI